MGIEKETNAAVGRGLDLQRSLILAMGIDGIKRAASTNSLPTDGITHGVQVGLNRGIAVGTILGADQLATADIEVNHHLALGMSSMWLDETLHKQIGLINGNTSRKILRLIEEMDANEYSFDWFEWKLEDLFGKNRAEGIGITITTLAYVMGAILAYRVSRLVDLIQIFTARDERVCRICRPLHLRVYPLTGHPILGLPAYHTKCRCYTAPVIDRLTR